MSINKLADNFLRLNKLGQGSFGTVYKVRRKEDNKLYAMKTVKIMNMKERQKKNALKQINLLASIQHPNIINYKEAFFDEENGQLCTVMQLASNGDLGDRIKRKKHFYQYQIWNIGKDIILGIEALHNNQILHRDIKPANIFFDENDQAKIGDLNVSKFLKDRLAHTQTGTPYYASPEVWNNQSYSFECDIWSFGCVMYEMCCSTQPFKGKDMDEIYSKVRRCQYKQIPSHYSPDLSQLIRGCLSLKHKRFSLPKIKQYFQTNTPPKSNQQPQNNNLNNICNLNETILFPKNYNQLAKVLPEPKYTNNSSTNQQDQFYSMISKDDVKKTGKPLLVRNIGGMKSQSSILDRFLAIKEKVMPSCPKIDQSVRYSRQSCQKITSRYRNRHSQKNLRINLSTDHTNENPQQDKKQLHKSPSFHNALAKARAQYSNKNLSKYDKFALQRLNLRRRKLRISMKM